MLAVLQLILYKLSGVDNILQEFHSIREILTQKSIESGQKIIDKKVEKERKTIRTNPEQQLYAPMCKYLSRVLVEKYKQEVIVHDTSAFYLDKIATWIDNSFKYLEY